MPTMHPCNVALLSLLSPFAQHCRYLPGDGTGHSNVWHVVDVRDAQLSGRKEGLMACKDPGMSSAPATPPPACLLAVAIRTSNKFLNT